MRNTYSEKITVKYSETDKNHTLKPYSLLNYLQDIADKNAEDMGFGVTYLSKKNCAWFLIKYRMEFSDYPTDTQDLTLTTEPRGYRKIFSYRDFKLETGNKTIGRMRSEWAIIDLSKHSMVNIGTALEDNPNMPPYTAREDDLTFEKIPPLNNIDSEENFEVRYNDLDKNGHANNGNYIIWALEPLDIEFRNTRKLKTLDIIFKKEAKYQEKVISQIQFSDVNTTIHRLTNLSGEDLCLLKCEWQKI